MKYFYKSDVGTFYIMPEHGRFSLWIKDNDGTEDRLGTYPSADSAADDVYMCATGFDEWDLKMDVMEPCDLSEWTRFS